MRRTRLVTRRQFLMASAAIATSCSGCTLVGPNFKTPETPVAPAYLDAGGQPMSAKEPDLRNWWNVFDDPALRQLEALAYAQNLTLQSAGARVLEARAELGIATGNVYPQVQAINGSLSYNRLSHQDIYSAAAPSEDFWRATLGPELVWELDFWGKFRRGVESATAAYLASVAGYDDVLVSLLGNVATTYIGIRTLQTQIAIAQSNIKTQRHALGIAQTRFDEGSTTRLDVYQAQDVLASTEAQLPQLATQLAQGKNALLVLLGMAPQTLDPILDESSGLPTPPDNVVVGMPADLLRRRPDVRAAELLAAAQSAQIGIAKADLYPAFSLFGSVGLAATDAPPASLSDFFTYKAVSFSFGPSFHWNILNYGQITNNVRVQDARLQARLIDYKNTVLTAQEEVENAIASFVFAGQQENFLRRSVKATQGALNLALIQYHEGLVDFTTVLTTEQNLLQAETNLAAAMGTRASSVAQIYRALGGGWEIADNQGFVSPATSEEMRQRTNWGNLLPPEGRPNPAIPTTGFWHNMGIGPPEW
ncbi:MAG TPA: efflux transporter outer membrane subunit [Acidocella sp.]|uniref:efflux transporter outer membrane subunit n=1 Tax=Acidocella sp. TaxID=50710 RepID=UPI002BE2266B|nr:efflux transporter outer membrane subunit [Acidocella sp.]HVE21726.1 efflux transporter outer membrane subunit [Acidocella sp.]